MTPADLHAMAQESRTAWALMPELCKALGYAYPPEPEQPDTAKRDAMPDPLQQH